MHKFSVPDEGEMLYEIIKPSCRGGFAEIAPVAQRNKFEFYVGMHADRERKNQTSFYSN